MIKGNRADCVTIAKFKEKYTYPYIHMHIHIYILSLSFCVWSQVLSDTEPQF